MRNSACFSAAIPFLAVLGVDGCPAMAQLRWHPDTITPGTIKPCGNKLDETKYYIVNLHIPHAAALLTSAPCSAFPHGCVESNNTAIPVSTSSIPTLLDVNLSNKLWQNVPASANGTLLLHIVLEDSNMHFMSPYNGTSYAVQQDQNDQMFACATDATTDPSISNGHPYVDVLVKQQTGSGSLNLGIDVDESNGHGAAILPIILDPHVPNNG